MSGGEVESPQVHVAQFYVRQGFALDRFARKRAARVARPRARPFVLDLLFRRS